MDTSVIEKELIKLKPLNGLSHAIDKKMIYVLSLSFAVLMVNILMAKLITWSIELELVYSFVISMIIIGVCLSIYIITNLTQLNNDYAPKIYLALLKVNARCTDLKARLDLNATMLTKAIEDKDLALRNERLGEARVKELEARLTQALKKVEQGTALVQARLDNANLANQELEARVGKGKARVDQALARVFELEPSFATYKSRRRQNKDKFPELTFKQFTEKTEYHER